LLLVNVPANAPAPTPSLTNSSSPNNKLGSNGGVKKAGSSKPKSGKSGGGGTAKTRAS
jgi:hypothetical protein